jgi:hypothetical protein
MASVMVDEIRLRATPARSTIPDSEAYVSAAVRVATGGDGPLVCSAAARGPFRFAFYSGRRIRLSWLPAEMNGPQAGWVRHGFGGPPVGRSRGAVARAAAPLASESAARRMDFLPTGGPLSRGDPGPYSRRHSSVGAPVCPHVPAGRPSPPRQGAIVSPGGVRAPLGPTCWTSRALVPCGGDFR